MTLTVMTYNIRCFKDDRAALRRVIGHMQPDVLLLQEVPRHPLSDHRVAAFAESLGMLWAGGARHRMSTTLFTAPRLDVHAAGHGLYSVPRPQEPRGYGWAEVSLGGSGHVVVVSTHMTLHREQLTQHTEELFADPQVPHDLPWIVGGDLNDTPGGPVADVMTQHLVDVGGPAFTSPAVGPVKRIDFIYASKTLAVTPKPVDAELSDLEHATDHRPVVVTVELPRAS